MHPPTVQQIRKGARRALLVLVLGKSAWAQAAAPAAVAERAMDWSDPATCSAWVSDVTRICKSSDPAVRHALNAAAHAAHEAAAHYERDAARCASPEPLSAISRGALRQRRPTWHALPSSSLERALTWVALLRRQACLAPAQQAYVWALGQVQSVAHERAGRADEAARDCLALAERFDLRDLFDSFLYVRQARTFLTFTPSEQAAIEQISACLSTTFDATEARDAIFGADMEK